MRKLSVILLLLSACTSPETTNDGASDVGLEMASDVTVSSDEEEHDVADSADLGSEDGAEPPDLAALALCHEYTTRSSCLQAGCSEYRRGLLVAQNDGQCDYPERWDDVCLHKLEDRGEDDAFTAYRNDGDESLIVILDSGLGPIAGWTECVDFCGCTDYPNP